jgi:alcohol dehydrogenase (nicotinoprotein)
VISRAAVIHGLNQPFVIEEVEWDDPREDEVAVRVAACGVCYSDYHAVNGDYPMIYPAVLGHEGVGIVEQVGDKVTRVKPGDKIVMSWMPSCGHCPACVAGQGQLCDRGARLLSGERDDGSNRMHGIKGNRITQFSFLSGFSEYVVIPEDGCIPLDPDTDLIKVPVVGCRAPTGIGAVINTANVEPAATALVVGLGGVGFNVIQGLKLAGAHIIIAADIVDKRQWAMDWGATHYIDCSKQDIVEEVMNVTGIGVDYSFDAIGRGEIQSACVAATHKGGRTVWVGVAPHTQKSVELDAMNITLYQRTVGGTCYGGRSPFEMVPQIMKLYRSGIVKLDELITRYYSLDDINDAFADMLAGKNISGCIRMD